MKPTRLGLLAAIATLAGAAGWVLTELMRGQFGRVVPVPWTAAAAIWVLAVAVLLWAVICRPRLLRHEGARPMAPLVAARTAALAMAASRTGAVVAGLYLGLLLGTLPARDTPAGLSAIWADAITALGAIALTAAALWLERLCRLPSGGNGTAQSGRGASQLGSTP